MASFDPRRVLRQVSNSLLQRFFEKRQIALDVKWETLKETAIEPIFDAWQELEDEQRADVEAVLHDLHVMASEEGVKVLVNNGDTWGKDLRDELEKLEGRHDKAMWAYLEHFDVWALALKFARADHLCLSRNWTKRNDVIKKAIPIAADGSLEQGVRERLETALCAFFKKSEGRGHTCRVEHEIRKPSQHYFFVSLSDYTDTYDKLDPKRKQFVRESEQRAFSVVIAYDPDAGQLDVCSKGGKKVIAALQDIFGREVLGISLPPEDEKDAPYDLRVAMDPNFDFPVDPSGPIESVCIRRVRYTIKNTKRRIQFEADPERGPRDVHEMLDVYIRKDNLPRSLLDVDQLALSFQMKHEGGGKPPTFTCTLSPRSCDLKSKRSEQREAGEKCLKAWGIDHG